MINQATRQNYISAARPILQRLEGAGFEAFLVGGCVRESLRGELSQGSSLSLTDIDVTTNALPEEICELFADLAVIPTGIKHGTVTVLLPAAPAAGDPAAPAEADPAIPSHRIPIEITTYRIDGDYSDGRHPDQVSFVSSLTEDLRRRDFTVNAMAMDLRGKIADPFGGQDDLREGIIRAVGDPRARFQEDGLRILRAMRFAAVLTSTPAQASRPDTPHEATGMTGARGFRIDPATEEALHECAPLLRRISVERLFAELKKLVCGAAAADVIRHYVDILAVVIPELNDMKGFAQNNPYHKYDVLEHCIRAMESVRTVTPPSRGEPQADGEPQAGNKAQSASGSQADGEPQAAPLFCMKLAALLHDVGKPVTYTEDDNGIGHFYGHPHAGEKIAGEILQRLKADRFTTDRIATLICHHDMVFQEDERLLKRWINRYTSQILLEVLELKRADNIATGNVTEDLLKKFDRIEAMIREIVRSNPCLCAKDLAVNGRDLIGLGIPEGPQVGVVLDALLDEVIDGRLPNDREPLLAWLRNNA